MKWLAVLLLCSRAYADDHTRAVKLFEEGRKLLGNKDPAGACAKFDEAIALEPQAAGTMLNLGLCNEQLGKLRAALTWFRKAEVRATETVPALPEYEKAAREHTLKLAALVATVKITGDIPSDAVIKIDGEPIKPEELARVELDPGHHVVIATAPGKQEFRRELDAARGKMQGVTVELVDAPAQEPTPAPTPAPQPPPLREQPVAPAPSDPLPLYLALGGGALLVGSLGLTLYEKSVYNQYASAARMGDRSALQHTRDANDVAKYYGSGLAIGGLVAIGAAGYLYFSAAPDHVAVAVAGRF